MRTALRSKGKRQQVSRVYSFNAPVKGWFTAENTAAMPTDSAYVLVNWYPETDTITVRPGFIEYAELPDDGEEPPAVRRVGSLMVYEAGSARFIFAAAGDAIYDVTAGGTITTAAVGSLTGDHFSWTNFATTGGNYLVACNGADTPQIFNGSAWAAMTITGADEEDFRYVFPFKGRLFFLEKASTNVWYLPIDAITGAVGLLPVGGELSLGGTIVACGALTHDGGYGPDDFLCFVSSEGEVVIYAGTDPGDAAAWAKRGTFHIGKPVGDRCVIKSGGDVSILTQDGVASLSRAMLMDRANAQRAVFTGNINNAFAQRYTATGSTLGWELLTWPTRTMAIVNTPAPAGGFEQFVSNVLTGAWTKFTGINATCWTTAGDAAYFGTADGRVMQFGTASSDDGEEIDAIAILAWSNMRSPGIIKHAKAAQVFLRSAGEFVVGMNIAADFQTVEFATVTTAFGDAVSGGEWDTSLWDAAVWAGAQIIGNAHLGVAASGYFLAPAIFAQTVSAARVQFLSMNVIYETGNIIG
jgi:hypothetical protein